MWQSKKERERGKKNKKTTKDDHCHVTGPPQFAHPARLVARAVPRALLAARYRGDSISHAVGRAELHEEGRTSLAAYLVAQLGAGFGWGLEEREGGCRERLSATIARTSELLRPFPFAATDPCARARKRGCHPVHLHDCSRAACDSWLFGVHSHPL